MPETLLPAGDPRITYLIGRLNGIKRIDDATREEVENLPLPPATTSTGEETVIDPVFDTYSRPRSRHDSPPSSISE